MLSAPFPNCCPMGALPSALYPPPSPTTTALQIGSCLSPTIRVIPSLKPTTRPFRLLGPAPSRVNATTATPTSSLTAATSPQAPSVSKSGPKSAAAEAEELGLSSRPHPNNEGQDLLVGMPKLFVMRSRDGGESWQRRDWLVPGFSWMTAFPRWIRLQAGNILLPIYAMDQSGDRGQVFVWRSDTNGENWRLIPLSSSISSVAGDETCFIETSPGTVLAHIRHASPGGIATGYLLESWSEDAGLTWSQPLRTDIKGYPPHLLRLQDGRILCGVTYRWDPMGIRLVLSEDNGQSWDTDNTIVLRDDAGTASPMWPDYPNHSGGSDVGYPITVQFDDGSLFTCYWITLEDGICHAAYTKWRLDEI